VILTPVPAQGAATRVPRHSHSSTHHTRTDLECEGQAPQVLAVPEVWLVAAARDHHECDVAVLQQVGGVGPAFADLEDALTLHTCVMCDTV
jgi:hypothetical protein